ncbi:3-hydroxyacyl-CoA dehydrogenase family protein [Amycolatopsis sp. NPDC058278]|uniref:3-hydroxyacyl-CoA dehydrogenase family protein n=1 Tax=Amycolatopsis sp. NPDC058278 TaxID=3346417 RepID=UPI0036D864BC
MIEQGNTVGVVGLGSLGLPLVELLVEAGVPVIAVDVDPAAVERARSRSIAAHNGMSVLSAANLVVEAVPEHRETKRAVLRTIAEVCPPDTVLVSTTASLSLMALAAESGRPSKLVGLRFMVPPAPGGTCEVTRTAMSEAGAASAVDALVSRLPLAVKDFGSAQMLAWQLLLGYLNRAVSLYESGYATREDIDTAMKLGCGLPAGPLTLLDHLGVDSVRDELAALHERTRRAAHAPAALLSDLVGRNRLGRKAGMGVYDYGAAGVVGSPRPDRTMNAVPRPVSRIGVVGSGTMGRGIAQVTALGGFDTVLSARTQEKAEAAIEAIDAAMVRAVRRGQIRPEARRQALARIHPSSGYADLGDRDVVMEAVTEVEDIKAEVFGALGRVCRPGAVLTTTTSSLSVADCAEAADRRADVVGMHFFHPAPVMGLVEVSRTEFTGDDVLATAHTLARSLGKTPVNCTDRAGFIVNYLLFPYLNDAVALVEAGAATIEELDQAVENGLGHPLGPFALMDAIGLDVCEAIQKRLHDVNDDPDIKSSAVLTALVASDRLGRKVGAGFYNHDLSPFHDVLGV